MSTFDVGLLNNSYTLTDSLNFANPDDTFSFQLSDTRSLKLSLVGLSTPVDWQLRDNSGTILYNGSVNLTNSEAINFSNLVAGDYSLKVSQTGDGTDYTLKIDPMTGLSLDSGFFTVGKTGQVGVDYLIDGGAYQGELAIFSLTGMESFVPGSELFTKEVARRSLSNSTEGYVAIQDATEGAKFSPTFPWGDSQNSGEYKNTKTFIMTPGEKFGFMLVPNGTVQEVFDNPSIGGAKRPLFSLVSANPNEAFHVGQIADVTGDGKIFVMEDKRIDTGSDKDYNDLVFRITGATGKAVKLDDVIDPGKDWRPTKIGDDLRDYINTPPQFLQFNTNSVYQLSEIVNLIDAKVFDENGDLDKVELSWFKDGNEIKHDVINQFTVNEDWATFNYSWTPTTPGNYQLKAIAYDKYGNPPLVHQSNEVIKDIRVNSPPERLQFNISKNLYNAGEPISITASTVDDADGFADLSKVQFWLKKDNDEWIANNIISSFSSLSETLAGFTYNLPDLKPGSYQLKAVAYDKTNAASNEVIQSFSILKKPDNPLPVINTLPEYLQFNLQESYQYGETINFTNGKVYDANGFTDLKNVHIKLQKDGSNSTDYYVTNFQQQGQNNNWGIFNYSLNGLAPGNYYLEARAADQTDSSSNLVSKYFTVTPEPVPTNRAPESLEFSILPLYTNTEQISFSWGKVSDPDGASDIADVFFWLGTLDGKGAGVGDVKQFEVDDEGNARFDFSHDLNNLAPGRYQLWAIAQDKAGNYSAPATQNFAIITDPGDGGLADDERIAIADAGNLENYNPEALDKTKQWVVWLTPGESSQDLAAQIGAEDLGPTGYIPNTYIWKFPDTLTPDDAINLLSPRTGVEFFYPLVPTQLIPQFIPNDGLFPDQWHLQNTGKTGGTFGADINVIKAWDISVPNNPSKTVRGTGVVIGIVDDGIQYTHPDLAANYRWELSRDFNETIGLDGKEHSYRENPSFIYGFDPSPTYKTIIEKQSKLPIRDGLNENDDFLLVPLTGVTTDVNVSLNITYPQVSDLDAFLRSPNDPIFNPLVGSISGGNRRLPGGGDGSTLSPIELLTNIGGNGANFINTILDDEATKSIQNLTAADAPFTGSFSSQGKLSNFDNLYANGNWNLRVSDEVWNGKSGQINNWKLELDTYNPHGTSVAGLAAATGNNSMGVTGVAPGAGIAGLRLIADEVNDKQIADALFYSNKNIDIYNNSWKEKDELNLSPSVAAMRLGTSLGRANGLGNIYVFAGGNNRWSGGNVNYNGFANSRYVIPVAAIDHQGKYTWYSEKGAPLLVSAYSSSVNNADGKPVGITTTDLLGNQGFDGSDYTSRFSGTSSAAPLVSGTIALMLEANPNLSWRDVEHILVNTAKKTDPNDKDWKQNGAGLWVNHNYGFGVIDAAAAVSTATNWTPVDKETDLSSLYAVKNVFNTIRDGDNKGVVSKINIDRDITVEKVEVLFNTKPLLSGAEKWKYWGDLRVVLTSPDGTESILAEPHKLANDPDAYNINSKTSEFTWKFSSARHWGESSKGEWKLQVFDEDGNQVQGRWNSWKLNLYGTKPTVTVNATDANASESGDPGAFTITRTGNLKNDLIVNYSLGGNAIKGVDYIAPVPNGSIKITGGQSKVTIPIAPIDDARFEGNENVIVSLATKDAYSLGSDKSATVTIVDNDKGVIVADSVQDFSFTQGKNNWYYGYYDGNLTSQDFKQFTVTDPSFGWIINGTNYFNSTYWTFVGPTDIHPSGLAPSNRTNKEQWATRRWISEVGGTINLSGTLKKVDTTGGNGVVGRIYIDGIQVWSQGIVNNDGVGVNYNFNTTVKPGSKVDFVLDPKNSEQFNDRSLFTAVVTQIG